MLYLYYIIWSIVLIWNFHVPPLIRFMIIELLTFKVWDCMCLDDLYKFGVWASLQVIIRRFLRFYSDTLANYGNAIPLEKATFGVAVYLPHNGSQDSETTTCISGYTSLTTNTSSSLCLLTAYMSSDFVQC